MGFRQAYVKMTEAAGGRDNMARELAITTSALDNRVHEKGTPPQRVYPDMAIQMQVISGTTFFAEEVAHQSGGTFVPLPQVADQISNEEIHDKFLHMVEHVGELANAHRKATEDGHVDADERANLDAIAQQIHRSVQELLALTYLVYSKPQSEAPSVHNIATRKVS
ncbi:YmfL family putative regulatory protein [Paraburkholderia sp. PREW-6R]|uniref:YmfL family putative regulatory protein n=1 Tax=Paraburkholderia sp. PREW-6R TaxID=3141544 RepID=UPI0031F52C80